MTGKTRDRLWLGYGIFLSVLTVAVGVLFIAQAADIYFGGGTYTRQIVAEHLRKIALPCWLWIGAVVIGLVGQLWRAPGRTKLVRDDRATMDRLLAGVAEDCDHPEYVAAAQQVRRAEALRRRVWIGALVVCLICGLAAAVTALDLTAYPERPNNGVLRLVRLVLPWVAVAFAACIVATVYDGISARRTLPLVRIMRKLAGTQAVPAKPETRYLTAIRLTVLVLAVVLICWGVWNGGAGDVFRKAVNICTECIGLG